MDELERWAAQAVEGDPLAAAAFVRATQRDVWRLCAHLTDAQVAEDLTQETYLRAFPALHRFQGGRACAPGCFRSPAASAPTICVARSGPR